MNTEQDINNPAYCSIRRVENGWVLNIGEPGMGYEPLARYVFSTATDLALFVQNFYLPNKTFKNKE